MKLDKLTGLMPSRLIWDASHTSVEWLDLSNITFSEPFLNQTIARYLRDEPNHRRVHTNLDVLDHLYQSQPGLEPTGFIFHTQRCGSTLISKALSALPQNIVLSEPRIIAEVLGGNIFGSLDFLAIQADEFWPSSSDLTNHAPKEASRDKIKDLDFRFEETVFAEAQKITCLRQIINALGQKQFGWEKNYFIKFSSQHILDFPLIRKAFPYTPCIFLYRDPMEVIVSILKTTWAFDWSINRHQPWIVATVNSLSTQEVEKLSYEEYYCIILASFFHAALAMAHQRILLLNYSQLPEALWTSIPDYFQLSLTRNEIEKLKECTQYYSKSPEKKALFHNDGHAKKREATELLNLMVDKWLTQLYQRLESTTTDIRVNAS